MKFIFSFFLVISSYGMCQTTPLDFGIIDSTVKNIPFSAPDTLAQNLTAAYTTDIAKVRSIFKWIAENIGYDIKGYYNLNDIYKGLFQPEIFSDSGMLYKNYNDNIVKKVLSERVAICDGYTRLFKTLCDYANINCQIIVGYIRWYTDPIGEQTKRLHAWNAVQINNNWYLLDPTWASGYSNTDITNFKKEYDDYYFLTPPDKMLNDHFPIDSKWTLVSNPLTIDQFYNQPHLFPAFTKYKIKSYKPSTGVLEAKVGGKVCFELETDEREKEMDVLASLKVGSAAHNFDDVSSTSISDLLKPKYTVVGNKVTYTYIIKSSETKELNIIYKGEVAMRYRVRLVK